MALTAAQLVVNVRANVGQAVAGLNEVNASAGHASGGLKGFLSGMLGMAAGQLVFQALSTAMMKLQEQVTDTYTKTNEWQAVQNQLNSVLKSTGDASGMTAAQINAMSNALSQQSTYNNIAIGQAQNILLTFTGIGQQVFPQTTQATLDLATAMHENLNSAALQVGKAIGDPVLGMTALRREGVNLSKSQQQLIKHLVATGDTLGAQKIILGELSREFGGSAVAKTKNFAGQMILLNNSMDRVKETVGAAVIPILVSLLEKVTPLASAFGRDLPGAIKSTEVFLSGMGKAFEKAFGGTASSANLKLLKQDLADVGGRLGQVAGFIGANFAPAMTHLATGIGTAAGATVNFLGYLQSHQTLLDGMKALLIGVAAGATAYAVVTLTALVPAFIAQTVAAGAAAVATLAATWPLLAVGAAVAVVAFGIIELVKHWGQVSAFFTNMGKGVGKTVSSWSADFQHGVKAVQTILDTGFKRAVNFIETPIREAVKLFNFLYQHNYYFKDLVDSIRKNFALAQGVVHTVIADVRGVFTAGGQFLRTLTQTDWKAIQDFIVKPAQAAWTFLSTGFANVRTILLKAFNLIVADVKTWMSDFITPIKTDLANLGTDMEQAGQNLMKMLAKGITDAAGQVGQAAQGVAKNVEGMLGFHSPTREGPGAKADRWMPNLGAMMTSGLQAQAPATAAAAKKVASGIAAEFAGLAPTTGRPSSLSVASATAPRAPSVASATAGGYAARGASGGGASAASSASSTPGGSNPASGGVTVNIHPAYQTLDTKALKRELATQYAQMRSYGG